MATLHVLSHSPFGDNRLASCLRLLGRQDGLLLCGDATYALRENTPLRRSLEQRSTSTPLFVLDEDAEARGLALPNWVKGVDYPGFVELSIRYDKVNGWL